MNEILLILNRICFFGATTHTTFIRKEFRGCILNDLKEKQLLRK